MIFSCCTEYLVFERDVLRGQCNRLYAARWGSFLVSSHQSPEPRTLHGCFNFNYKVSSLDRQRGDAHVGFALGVCVAMMRA